MWNFNAMRSWGLVIFYGKYIFVDCSSASVAPAAYALPLNFNFPSVLLSVQMKLSTRVW